MPFIGNQPAEAYSSFQKQDFTTSATTSYTLDHPVANGNEIALFINFVRQEPTAAYTASGTSLTLTSATTSSDDMYCVFLGKAVQTVNPPNGSVGTAQLADSSVTSAKLSGITQGITEADMWRLSAGISISSATTTTLGSNWERVDDATFSKIGTGMTESSGIFTFPSTGIYQIILSIGVYTSSQAAEEYFKTEILGTSNNSTYVDLTQSSQQIADIASFDYARGYTSTFFDVTDTSTHKVKFAVFFETRDATVGGKSTETISGVQFLRLGDT